MRFAIAMGLLGGCGRIHYDAVRSRDASTDSSMDAPVVEMDAPDRPDVPTDPPTCPPSLPGLLGWWTMDEDDVVGTSVRDVSGNERHGTWVGVSAPVVVPGRLEGALDFAGTSGAHVSLAAVPVDSSAGASTSISFWLRHDDTGADEGVLCMTPTATPEPPRYCLWLTSSGAPQSLCVNGGTGECWGVRDAPIFGRWVHVVAIFANGRADGSTLFLDGVPVTMECEFGTCDQERTIQGPIVLGMEESGYSWHGRIDDVRVFDRALSAAEVARLFACAP